MKWLEKLFLGARKQALIPQSQQGLLPESAVTSPTTSGSVEQEEVTEQEIVLIDPDEIMKPWSMTIPLDLTGFHFEGLEEEDPKSILIREMNYWCQDKFSYYRVSLLSPVNEDTFARYTIRERWYSENGAKRSPASYT
jgi:hypothetical protein